MPLASPLNAPRSVFCRGHGGVTLDAAKITSITAGFASEGIQPSQIPQSIRYPLRLVLAHPASCRYVCSLPSPQGIIVLGRFLKWALVLTTIAAAAGLVGLAINNEIWKRDWSTIDDGWASLIGSAVGSFLAVVGALYVSKSEDRRKKKEFEDFVRVAVQNLVVQASYLEAMAREPHKIAPTPEVQAGIISIQLRNLTDALAVFDREIAQSRDGGYQLRRDIVTLDAMLSESTHYLLPDTPTNQAIQNWHIGAYQVRNHASNSLELLRWTIPTPSSRLIGERIKELIETWRSYNIPTQPSGPISRTTIDALGQNIQHAHA